MILTFKFHLLSVYLHSANRGDSLDRNIDAENASKIDFFILVSCFCILSARVLYSPAVFRW